MSVYGVFHGGRLVYTTECEPMAAIYGKCAGLTVRRLRCAGKAKCEACKGCKIIMGLTPEGNHRCGACNGTGRAK